MSSWTNSQFTHPGTNRTQQPFVATRESYSSVSGWFCFGVFANHQTNKKQQPVNPTKHCSQVPTTLPKRAEAAVDSGGRRYCQSTSQAHGAARRAFMSRATLLAAPCSQPSRRLPLPWTRGAGKRAGVIDDAEGDTHEEVWAWAGRRRPDGGRAQRSDFFLRK